MNYTRHIIIFIFNSKSNNFSSKVQINLQNNHKQNNKYCFAIFFLSAAGLGCGS